MEPQSPPAPIRTVSWQRDVLRILLYTSLLFVSFNHDFFQLVGDWRDKFMGWDSHMVVPRLQLALDGAPPLQPMWIEGVHSQFYISQVGLQAIVLGSIVKATHSSPIPFAFSAAAMFSLATAALLALFFASVARFFDSVTALAGVVLTAWSPHFLGFAPSPYWSTPLLFAPFVLTWVAFPWLRERRYGYLCLAGIVFLSVMGKALCGYEYITTVALSPLPAMLFHYVRAREANWRGLVRLMGIAMVSCAAFAAALGLHAAQLRFVIHRDPIQTIRDKAMARTVSGATSDRGAERAFMEKPQHFEHPILNSWPRNISYPVNCFAAFFRQPAFTLPHAVGNVRVYRLCEFLCAVCVGLVVRRRASDEMRALFAALGLGFATALSWQVCALNHMCVHIHLNLIVFYIPFLLLGYVVIGKAISNALTLIASPRAAQTLAYAMVAALVISTAYRMYAASHALQPQLRSVGQIRTSNATLCLFGNEQTRNTEH